MDDCDCEGASQSWLPSPGSVKAGEIIIRLVFRPEQINEDGSLKPTSIPQADLEMQVAGFQPFRGYSVNREAFVDSKLIARKAAEHRQRKPEERHEVWTYAADVDQIRLLKDQNQGQALCVVDRAEPGDPSHAECWGAQPGRKPAEIKKIRADLAALFTPKNKVIG